MMRLVTMTCFLLLSGGCTISTNAWMMQNMMMIRPSSSSSSLTPQNFLPKAIAMASLMTEIATTSPLAVNAAAPSSTDFTGSYSDPKHPNCLREIQVIAPEGKQASVTGTDGTPGCPPDGSGKEWKLMGKIDGNTILVDFTPKGGPKDLKGIWEDATPTPGIRWPDGNIWTVKTTTTIE